MLRNEIQRKTGLTRKALEYYEEKGLLHPRKLDNGYRNYSEKDEEVLHKIALYRKLGLSISEIEQCFSSEGGISGSVLRKKQYQAELAEKKQALLEQLVKGECEESIGQKLAGLDVEETIFEKLEKAFPGYFGQMIFSAYQMFLDRPLEEEGEEAYAEYVSYLDELPPLPLTEEERKYIEQMSAPYDRATLKKLHDEKMRALENPEQWWAEHEEWVSKYESYKNSAPYQTSLMKTIQDKMTQYFKDNKYYETAIPLIRKFSPAYDAHYKKMLEANAVFLKHREKRDEK